ncbi:hypothetical protein ACP70R_026142 [Stipagrostis hirtigluma subsp. patula]
MDTEVAPAPRVRWKKPSSGPQPRKGDAHRGPNPTPPGASARRIELKRRLRASAEAAALALAAAVAARQSDPGVRVDGGHGAVQRLGPAGLLVDAGQAAVQTLWSDADEVTLLAAAVAFRERTGRAPRRPDAGALFEAIRDSVSPHIDEAEVYDKLRRFRFESRFLNEATAGSAGTHHRRVRDLCASVWGAVDKVASSDDDSCGQGEIGEGDADDRRLSQDAAAIVPEVTEMLDEYRNTAPSERLPALPMATGSAPASPSPPRSKRRSSTPQPHMSDDLQSSSPSPRGSLFPRSELKRSLRTSAGTAALSLAAAALRFDSSFDGDHDAVQSPEPTSVQVDGGHSADQGLGPAGASVDAGHGAAHNSQTTWSNADEVMLLTAAAGFRERTGRAPRHQDAGALLDSIRDSISPHIDTAKASYKLRRFKGIFLHEAPGSSATAHDRRVHDLCAKVWGVVEHRVVPDAAPMMPVVTEVLGEYWKLNERALAGLPLEKGLSLLGEKQGRLMETKWKLQIDEELQTHMRWQDLAKEVAELLYDTIKDLGS